MTASEIENSVWSSFHHTQTEAAKDMSLTNVQTLDYIVVETSIIVTLVRKSLGLTGVGVGKTYIRASHLSENYHTA